MPLPVGAYAPPSLTCRYAELKRAVGASERLLHLLHREPALPLTGGTLLPPREVRGAVELRDVTFAYPANPDVAVLRGASLSIAPGERVALLGPSGCGKSTVAALLCGLYAPSSGVTTLDGHDVLSLDGAQLRAELVATVPRHGQSGRLGGATAGPQQHLWTASEGLGLPSAPDSPTSLRLLTMASSSSDCPLEARGCPPYR